MEDLSLSPFKNTYTGTKKPRRPEGGEAFELDVQRAERWRVRLNYLDEPGR